LVDSQLPPLLQSDVRTTETSHGAGLVDREGRLIGILVTTEAGEERSGWAYAVPVWHVSRLVQAMQPGELVTLEQQRPMLGLVLSNNRDQGGVRVVEALVGSPAEAAGLQADDLLKSVGDVAVRHPYQVQAQVLKRVPGDSLSIAYERDGEPHEVEVTLSSDSRVQQQAGQATDEDLEYQQDAHQAPVNSRFGPQLKVQLVAPNQFEIRNSGRAANALPRQSAIGQEVPRPTDVGAVDEKILQLERSVETLQAEVKRRSKAESELLKQIRTLTDEVDQLRKKPAAQPAKGE
jgi:membrane-associated protease RseP (regulator of RpoE activity)